MLLYVYGSITNGKEMDVWGGSTKISWNYMKRMNASMFRPLFEGQTERGAHAEAGFEHPLFMVLKSVDKVYVLCKRSCAKYRTLSRQFSRDVANKFLVWEGPDKHQLVT